MKVLVIGSGGREHTLAWKLSQAPSVTRVLWAPGNPAAPAIPKLECRPIKAEDIPGLLQLAKSEKVDLTIVGPEAPLVAGLADQFRASGLAVFGPTQAGAQLEGSKVFSKKFFIKHGIPTGSAEFFTDTAPALKYARSQPLPLVVKADGLAAGKGVIICHTHEEVESALRDILDKKVFGDAGNQVLIEECMTGLEVSVHAITDGQSYQLLASAQDHKRAFDNDEGPNTGGMGTYSPAPIFTPELEKQVRREFFDRTLAGLRADGIPYCGVLYAGLMLTPKGPRILEYNCRFGDPETQVILSRLDTDLGLLIQAACEGKLQSIPISWKKESSVCVVMAAGGYPGSYRKGDVIHGLDAAGKLPGIQVFHAGTSLKDGKVVTSGGRVLGVTALGNSLPDAVAHAYQAVNLVQFEGCQFRKDVAAKGLKNG